jgi:hypothetical protein
MINDCTPALQHRAFSTQGSFNTQTVLDENAASDEHVHAALDEHEHAGLDEQATLDEHEHAGLDENTALDEHTRLDELQHGVYACGYPFWKHDFD